MVPLILTAHCVVSWAGPWAPGAGRGARNDLVPVAGRAKELWHRFHYRVVFFFLTDLRLEVFLIFLSWFYRFQRTVSLKEENPDGLLDAIGVPITPQQNLHSWIRIRLCKNQLKAKLFFPGIVERTFAARISVHAS